MVCCVKHDTGAPRGFGTQMVFVGYIGRNNDNFMDSQRREEVSCGWGGSDVVLELQNAVF